MKTMSRFKQIYVKDQNVPDLAEQQPVENNITL